MGSPSGSHAPSTICMALLWTLWVRPGTFSFHIFVDRGSRFVWKIMVHGFPGQSASLYSGSLPVLFQQFPLFFIRICWVLFWRSPPPCFIVAFCSVLFWQHPRCNLVDSKGFTLAVLFCFGSGRLLGIILVFSQVLFWQRWHSPKGKRTHA